MRHAFGAAVAIGMVCALSPKAQATTLQVSPVLIDVAGEQAADKVILRNLGQGEVKAQIRLFKWSQRDGKNYLDPTREVIASPPIASIAPGGEQVVRIVRVDRGRLAGEASYRLLVDQLPQREARSQSGVNFVMRYSVPVFFAASRQSQPQLAWDVRRGKGVVTITASNAGARRVRISDLGLAKAGNVPVAQQKGLVGYVLGHSKATWTLRADSIPAGSQIAISAQGDGGPIRGQAVAR